MDIIEEGEYNQIERQLSRKTLVIRILQLPQSHYEHSFETIK